MTMWVLAILFVLKYICNIQYCLVTQSSQTRNALYTPAFKISSYLCTRKEIHVSCLLEQEKTREDIHTNIIIK